MPSLPSSNPELWLWILRAPNLGSASLRSLLSQHDSLDYALEAGPKAWQLAGLDRQTIEWMKATPMQASAGDLDWLADPDNHLVTLQDEDYPSLLRKIPDPPAALYVTGSVADLWQPMVAIVGSRNASPGGLDNAADFAATFARRGFSVVSGLARGVDGAAHDAVLRVGGVTVAVLGTGVDRIYPSAHKSLAQRVAQQGALVSEYPPGTSPKAENFPRRNRIISGLALGTLVVEAGIRSGSLITARLSGEQGRDIFAIPGSIHNPMARGCHQLIRQGAKLVENADEVVAELGPLALELAMDLRTRMANEEAGEEAPLRSAESLNPEYQGLVDALGHDPVGVDQIVERTGLTVDSVSSMLLILELEGYVTAMPGGVYVASKRPR